MEYIFAPLFYGTHFSSAHAYRAEGGMSLFRCRMHVKNEMGVQEFPTPNKNAPTIKGAPFIVGYFFVVLGKLFAYSLGYFLQSHIEDNSPHLLPYKQWSWVPSVNNWWYTTPSASQLIRQITIGIWLCFNQLNNIFLFFGSRWS